MIIYSAAPQPITRSGGLLSAPPSLIICHSGIFGAAAADCFVTRCLRENWFSTGLTMPVLVFCLSLWPVGNVFLPTLKTILMKASSKRTSLFVKYWKRCRQERGSDTHVAEQVSSTCRGPCCLLPQPAIVWVLVHLGASLLDTACYKWCTLIQEGDYKPLLYYTKRSFSKLVYS